MSSVIGLELPNAWRTGQFNDSNFDISADQLNITINRELWIPSGSINWATAIHTNASDPINAQDLATKNYVDLNGGALWSTFPAQQDVDYVSLYKNINMVDPINPQDSATKNYVDNNSGATELDELTDVTIVSPLDAQFLRYNSISSQWENVTFTPTTGPAIEAGNSSVTVIDTGVGRVETNIDGIVRSVINSTSFSISVPIDMNNQQINEVGNPALASDAATKGYVDTEIANAGIKTDLDSLDDVTITTPLINQSLIYNGTQWINMALSKSLLPSSIAYEDEINIFTSLQNFPAGMVLGPDVELDMNDGFISNLQYMQFDEQLTAPPDPPITDSIMYLADGSDFSANDPQPTYQVLIDRSGIIEVKPIPTSETIFALNQFTNGMFTEETGVRLISDGGIGIRVQQFNENTPSGGFEVVLNGQIRLIADPDISPSVSNTIDLSVGTDISPITHFVWTELVADVPTMTSSTVGFPTTGDFAVIGKFILQSQASVLADGPYADNAPDNEIFDSAIRGHLAHINDRLISLDSTYVSGIDISVTPPVGGGTAGNVTYTTTAGQAFELHQEGIEPFDITTGIALVENEGTQTSTQVVRVNDIGLDIVGLTCADGITVIGANDRVNLVLYTLHIDSEPNQTNFGINLPFSPYTNAEGDDAAIADANNWAIKTVPIRARGIALLIAEVVVKITGGGGTFEILTIKDLRGQIPGAASSGTTAGGGAGQLNDLSDVTINSPLLDQILIYDGAGQWLNQSNPAGLLAGNNVWAGYQDRKAITDPLDSGDPLVGRFFIEVIDAANTGVFCYLQRDNIQTKVRIA